MQKILVVDDDDDLRALHKLRLSDTYEVLETGVPEEALGMALEHKPVAILLDLMMPKLSGFELCQTLHTLSYTSRIPIFIVSGESAAKYKHHCEGLGAKDFIEKPVDYNALKVKLAQEIQASRPERRAHVRVAMRVLLKLRGVDTTGNKFEISTVSDNVSPGGFICNCSACLNKGDVVEVYMVGEQEHLAGRARATRIESRGTSWQRYGFQFLEITSDWILQGK